MIEYPPAPRGTVRVIVRNKNGTVLIDTLVEERGTYAIVLPDSQELMSVTQKEIKP